MFSVAQCTVLSVWCCSVCFKVFGAECCSVQCEVLAGEEAVITGHAVPAPFILNTQSSSSSNKYHHDSIMMIVLVILSSTSFTITNPIVEITIQSNSTLPLTTYLSTGQLILVQSIENQPNGPVGFWINFQNGTYYA